MLRKVGLVGDDFKIPDRVWIGGDRLNLNYKSCMEANQTMILKEASTFGLAWISDGATVEKMPLVNVLVL